MITVEYLQKLGACWTREQLEAAADLWPRVEGAELVRACSWSWFLGERLQAMETRDVLLRCDVALAHVSRLAPASAMQAMDVAQAFELAERAKVCAAELRAPRELDPEAAEVAATIEEPNPAALIATLAELGAVLARLDGDSP